MGMLDSVTLVAMAPSGATLVLRDRGGRLWLYPPSGAGRPRVVEPALAERVIVEQDLDRLDRDFASWTELDEFRQEQTARAGEMVVDVESLDSHDIELLLTVAERWLAGGEGDRARVLALRLLRVPVVRVDAGIYEQLVDLIDRLERPRLDLRANARTALQQAAHERWDMLRAA